MSNNVTTTIRPRKPRYCVGAAGAAPTYQGDSRIVAWAAWLIGRPRRLVAFDRRTYIINPTYWLRGEAPPPGFFAGEQ